MAQEGSGGVLPLAVARNLGDKTIEKRKSGAMEVEIAVRDMLATDHTKVIEDIIDCLHKDFLLSTSPNHRKGGLLGFAAVAVGLKDGCGPFLNALIPPVLNCFIDSDPRTRYHACEALYNIVKLARFRLLPHFNDIFEGLFQLSDDSSDDVRKAMGLVDSLLKEVVAECTDFDIQGFITELNSRIKAPRPNSRQFLIAWIQALNKMPKIDLIPYIPELLDGLFQHLGETKKELRQMAYLCLGEMLIDIKEARPRVDFVKMVHIILNHCVSEDQFIRLTAIKWLSDFILLAHNLLLPFLSNMIGVALPSLSHTDQDIQSAASECNSNMTVLVRDANASFDLESVVKILVENLSSSMVPTKMAALRWLNMLEQKRPDAMSGLLQDVFPVLLQTLSDDSEEVVTADLEVLSRVSVSQPDFERCLLALVALFRSDAALMHRRAHLIVCKLCVHLGPERTFTQLAKIIKDEKDPQFACAAVKHLNLILLTAAELRSLRTLLQSVHSGGSAQDFFLTLFGCWCHNPVSTLCLCLVATVYELASEIVISLSNQMLDKDTLIQLDKLVQLLESPIFTRLRVHLLEHERYPHLHKALYGLLMLMPQSSAFSILKTRLECVPLMHLPPSIAANRSDKPVKDNRIEVLALLRRFEAVRDARQQTKTAVVV